MKFLILLLWLFFISPFLYADTVYLKNGRKLEGKIVRITPHYIKLETEEGIFTCYKREIDNIKKDAKTLFVSGEEKIKEEPSGEVYCNQEYGFILVEPLGWHKHDIVSSGGRKIGGVSFTFEPHKDSFPVIVVSIDRIYRWKRLDSALDFAQDLIKRWQKKSQDSKQRLKIIEEPKQAVINGIKCCRFIVERTNPIGEWVRLEGFEFMRGKIVVSLQMMDYVDNFQKHLPEFEEMASTFKFLDSSS